MSQVKYSYELTESISENNLKFYFISKGKEDIIKVIQFTFLRYLDKKKVFNLGFGDYDIENDITIDDINTDNGDVYKVFNTVLSTIPIFFNSFKDSILMVQGSDSRLEYRDKCIKTCKKKCENTCKNVDRRINLYHRYIENHYESLYIDYQFLGGLKDENGRFILETYKRQKKYDSIFLFKKSVILCNESES